jgi:hypothetical protein
MARRVFYSFNFDDDAWRVSQVKNMGVVSGQPILTANKFEDVRKGGKSAIKRWIDQNMEGKSCVIVLIGRRTAGREWVEYEIKKGWKDGRALLGVHIHKLADGRERQSAKGRNPFRDFTINNGRTRLDSIVPVYDPAPTTSRGVYRHVELNLASWVEHAIAERQKH